MLGFGGEVDVIVTSTVVGASVGVGVRREVSVIVAVGLGLGSVLHDCGSEGVGLACCDMANVIRARRTVPGD